MTGAAIAPDSPPQVISNGEAIVILIGTGRGGCIGLAAASTMLIGAVCLTR